MTISITHKPLGVSLLNRLNKETSLISNQCELLI